MAARKRNGLSENTRLRIKTTMLVERLQKHILGECEMSQTQLRAIEVLLRKTLPDLSAVEHTGEMDHKHYAVSSDPLPETVEEWLKTTKSSGDPSQGRKPH